MSKPISRAAASRIQSATAKSNGGVVAKGSFAARAQAAANTRSTNGASTTGNPSGGSRDNNPPKDK